MQSKYNACTLGRGIAVAAIRKWSLRTVPLESYGVEFTCGEFFKKCHDYEGAYVSLEWTWLQTSSVEWY